MEYYYFCNGDVVLVAVVKFKRKIRKSGGTSAITVPEELLEALNWKLGDTVNTFIEEDRLVVEKAPEPLVKPVEGDFSLQEYTQRNKIRPLDK